MMQQWAGVLLVIFGCGSIGVSMAAAYSTQIRLLRQLIGVLDEMEWELQYHLTPLPELCHISAANTTGIIRGVFEQLASSLKRKAYSDVRSAMEAALSGCRIPVRISRHLKNLGMSLGRFDLQGQVQGLRSVKSACRRELQELENGKRERLRGYQTLALCAGAAVAIILI